MVGIVCCDNMESCVVIILESCVVIIWLESCVVIIWLESRVL